MLEEKRALESDMQFVKNKTLAANLAFNYFDANTNEIQKLITTKAKLKKELEEVND